MRDNPERYLIQLYIHRKTIKRTIAATHEAIQQLDGEYAVVKWRCADRQRLWYEWDQANRAIRDEKRRLEELMPGFTKGRQRG